MRLSLRHAKRFALILTILVAIVGFVTWQNNCIVISKSSLSSEKIPAAFHNFTIAHLSDLHNKKFGKNQSYLLKKLASASPDIIVVTGDLIDRRKYDPDTAMELITAALEIAPLYFVSGNHEAWSGKYPAIKADLEEAGANVLDNAQVEIVREGSTILLSGLSDPDFLTSSYLEGTDTSAMEEQLRQWSGSDDFCILLSHRPELFELYSEYGLDLIFAGHAHGGQFRIPFIGGLFAPDQGFFPKYTSGSHSKGGSTMFVSRGLGNSIIPVRILNRPEIVVVTLKADSDEYPSGSLH